MDYMTPLFKAIRQKLSGQVLYDGVPVAYYVSKFNKEGSGIYISGYSEREDDNKHEKRAQIDVTLSCFVRDGQVDDVASIAAQVHEILKPGVNSTFEMEGARITILTKPDQSYIPAQIDGEHVEQIDMMYNFVIN